MRFKYGEALLKPDVAGIFQFSLHEIPGLREAPASALRLRAFNSLFMRFRTKYTVGDFAVYDFQFSLHEIHRPSFHLSPPPSMVIFQFSLHEIPVRATVRLGAS